MSERKPGRSPRPPGIALVGTAADLVEASVWESALLAESIPCLVRNRRPGADYSYQVPFDMYGFDVFVPATALRRAQEVLGPSLAPRHRSIDGNERSGNFITNAIVLSVIAITGLFVAGFVIFLN